MMLFPPLCGSVSSVDTCINGSTVSGPSSILLPCFPSSLVLLHFCWPVDPASPRSANPFRRPSLFEFHFCPRDFLSSLRRAVCETCLTTEGQKLCSVWSLSVMFPSGCEDCFHVVSLTFLWHVPRVLFFPQFSCLPFAFPVFPPLHLLLSKA